MDDRTILRTPVVRNHHEFDGVIGTDFIADKTGFQFFPCDAPFFHNARRSNLCERFFLVGEAPDGQGRTDLSAGMARLFAASGRRHQLRSPQPFPSDFKTTRLEPVGGTRVHANQAPGAPRKKLLFWDRAGWAKVSTRPRARSRGGVTEESGCDASARRQKYLAPAGFKTVYLPRSPEDKPDGALAARTLTP